MEMREKLRVLGKVMRVTVYSFGVLFIAVLLFAFTTGPYWIYHWLGTSVSDYHFKPQQIIIMGGSGMPGESATLRLYYTARLAKQFPETGIFITQPAVSGIPVEYTDAWLMRQELLDKGIDSSRIFLEIKGKNTREEAQNVLKIRPAIIHEACVIVTSPEHMRRSILSFRKVGYTQLGGLPTFNASGPVELKYEDHALGGRNIPLPEVGNSIQLRYQFWNHLRYQVICYRELVALCWYKLRGWI
jgi:uncharacterized SAM-binding protein YcdF (DUF218 family)